MTPVQFINFVVDTVNDYRDRESSGLHEHISNQTSNCESFGLVNTFVNSVGHCPTTINGMRLFEVYYAKFGDIFVVLIHLFHFV